MKSHVRAVVIGGGVVGTHAARIAAGMGADVTVLDRSLPRMRYLDDVFGGVFKTAYSSAGNTAELITTADMVIGAVLIPGAAAPKLISREQLSTMKPGAALVDVAIDQGGCFETSKPTSHAEPTYVVDDVVHYCVTNMPGAVPRTSTYALTNATLPFVKSLAKLGWVEALTRDPHLANGLNVHSGHVNHEAVARDLGQDSAQDMGRPGGIEHPGAGLRLHRAGERGAEPVWRADPAVAGRIRFWHECPVSGFSAPLFGRDG